jgi:hypothetical protein
MATVKTPVRLLTPGDVLLHPLPGPVLGASRCVVLCVAHTDPGPVGLSLGRLGEVPAHLDRVATVSWQPDAVVDVDRPDLTPAQAAADQLLDVVRSVSRGVAPHPNTARALLEQIEPPHQAELRFDGAAEVATVRVLNGVATLQDVDLERLRQLDGRKLYAGDVAAEARVMAALSLLERVERLAAGGHDARVRILQDEVEVSSATVHENLARALRGPDVPK